MATVKLTLKRRSLFVGSYTPMAVEIDPASGLTIDDLEFKINSGLAGGVVSLSRGRDFDPKRPVLMLLAGYQPDTHVIEVFDKNTGNLVGDLKYRIVGTWRTSRQGPPLWFSGEPDAKLAGSAWRRTGGPQNVSTAPASGTRRIAILLVDTSDQRYDDKRADLQGHRDRWMNEIINGVPRAARRAAAAPGPGGLLRHFDCPRRSSGRCSCPGRYDDYFNADGSPKGTSTRRASPRATGNRLQQLRHAALRLAVRDRTSGVAWPYARIGNWGPYTTAEGNKNYGVISMPNEWGTTDNREIPRPSRTSSAITSGWATSTHRP